MAQTVPDPLPIGYALHRYVIEQELFSGRLGRTYKAKDAGRDVAVAITVLARGEGPEALYEFLERTRKAASKGHAYDLGHVPEVDLWYVVVAHSDDVGAIIDISME
jgi:hypothetical protein